VSSFDRIAHSQLLGEVRRRVEDRRVLALVRAFLKASVASASARNAETHIRNDKDTGLRNLPFRDFEHNRVWLMLVGITHNLLTWTQRLLLTGELARAEPKRLRYRLLHVAARLAFHAAKPRYASMPPGPGPPRSSPRTHAPARFPRPPDHAPAPTTTSKPAAPGATRRCPPTTPRPGSPAPRPPPAPPRPSHTQLANPSRAHFTPRMPP
jgi:hypothetical protein